MFSRKLKKYILGFMLTLPMILLFAVSSAIVYASSVTMEFVADDGMIIVGDCFTVEVQLKADQVIGKVSLNVVFDDTKIAYVSGPECVTDEGNVLTIKDEGAGASNGEKIYVLYFDAIATGSAYIKTAAPPEVYSATGEELTVTIKPGTVEIRENDILSDDNSLQGLTVKDSAGNIVVLTPSFNPDIVEYSAQVGNNITKCIITANPTDSKAKISLNNRQSALQVGNNDIKITIEAEDGSSRTYVIHMERLGAKDPTPEPTAVVANPTPIVVEKEPEVGITAEFKGYGTFITEYHTYIVATSLKNLKIPDGYEETTVFIDEDAVKVYAKKGVDPEHVLIALSDEKGNVAWYKYDRKEETLQRLWEEDISYNEVNLNYDNEILLALKKAENQTIMLAVLASVAGALAVILLIMNLIKKVKIRSLEDEIDRSSKQKKNKTAKSRTK